jgi:hypothetical protein
VGTAPGFAVEHGPSVLIALPGVPAELEWLLDHQVIPLLQDRLGTAKRLHTRVLHAAGVGESWVDQRIQDLEAMTHPTVGMLAHPGLIDIRIAAKLDSLEEAPAVIGPVEAEIRRRLGLAIFGADGDHLEHVTLAAIGERGWRMATVEAGTAGALAAALAPAGSPWVGGVLLPTPSPLPPAEMAAKWTGSLGADAILYVGLVESHQSAEIDIRLLAPESERAWQRKYGGPLVNAGLWAVAISLDLVRRHLIGGET